MMVDNKKALLAALAATTLLASSGVGAAASQAENQTMKQTPAEKDFSKLSDAGARAFQDLTLTRVAIFKGRVADAKKFASDADKQFDKAKSDESIFTEAEANLKFASSKSTAGLKAAENQSYQGEEKPASSADQMKTPIAWLPVNGAITINEDYTADPIKKAAVAAANKSLKSGDRKGALDRLRLAGLNMDITLAVVPLKRTIKNVRHAAELINDGKYYEGSQVLRRVQDSERFDAIDISGIPKAQTAKH
ncbi:YfdX family protein [Methylovirgula sp. HY1]|uniref:YfdX family protein n=1 Tax=Methylovirgula sp. HY1 TaxID=2822761 RepID=UPI001C5B769A|nr:YfdX family protein [Methylovirgula sp. HY1]QXX73544.1 hypothetical protein MHY1_00340 [Methylovirgula sp. HY1]